MTLYSVFYVASIFLYIVRLSILAYCILSWFRPRNRFYLWLGSFVQPFLAPFRRFSIWLMSRTRLPLDFSCWFALIGITIVERILWRLYALLATIA